MSAFEKVIGYETIKKELLQICDMLHNREIYEKLGAKFPQGVLLYGEPGLGKTLIAKSFIEESGLEAYIIRRNKGNNDFVGYITDTFKKAKENAPCIIFMDDMDKFANEDSEHCDAEEYVAIQSGIDEVKNYNVFILATVNDKWKLPDSLIRSGRFDRKIEMKCPNDKDANEIIKHYLSDKKVAKDINMDDLFRMMSYSSCARLETILNEAAISAAYERKTCIEMNDLVNAVLRMEYDSTDSYTKISEEDLKKIALHEAGHLVVAEVLCPGSVGLASLRSVGREFTGGFIHRCKEFPKNSYHILVLLAGKAAVEHYYSDSVASGCQNDIQNAFEIIKKEITENAVLGLGMVDLSPYSSENLNSRNEAVIRAEAERFILRAKDILLKNRNFLEKAADALLEKETLLSSDIRGLRESVSIKEVPA